MKNKLVITAILIIAVFCCLNLLSPKNSRSENAKIGHFVGDGSIPCTYPKTGRIYLYKCDGMGSECGPGDRMQMDLCLDPRTPN